MKSEYEDPYPGFTLGQGGLLNRFFAKTRLADPNIPGMAARITFALALTWLPLLISSIVHGLAWGSSVKAPFLYDPATQVRFLVAMPLLLIAEPVIGRGLGAVVRYLETSGIAREEDRPQLKQIIADANRRLGRIFPEILILALVVALAVTKLGAGLHEEFAPGVSNWGLNAAGDKNWAGAWYYSVSLPVYRFLMLRWIWRYAVWAWMLLRVSRLRLTLTPSHPDLAAGLGFLAVGQLHFGILAFAFSTQLAGLFSRKILFEGAVLQSYTHMILGYVIFTALFFLAPLLIFTPRLVAAKRRGLLEFGVLAEKYTGGFERKWIHQGERAGESMLGSSDFQSLADLGNSFEIVQRMRPVPFDFRSFFSLLISASLPFLPLIFFVFRFDELLLHAVQLVF
jgi:hypothetical protein